MKFLLGIIESILLGIKALFGKSNPSQPEPIVVEPLIKRKKVNIIIDKQVRTKYQSGWIKKVRKKPITEIVIHGTAGGTTAEGMLLWMLQGERAEEYYKGEALFHYLIDRDQPNIVEVLDTAYYVYHSSSGKHDLETIGIECINPSKTNREPLTENQYKILFNLIFNHLLPNFPTIKSIVSHDYNMYAYSKIPPKGCPGSGFDWTRLESELENNDFKFNKITTGAYEIIS
ncbi:MAG TPA: N-acetylmuramoyl-L-alanine amidase [Methanofastidiosum sp.]|nr:N-acetylmuramoyl-L-alanine amidase [Methanofastidiosum sp.]